MLQDLKDRGIVLEQFGSWEGAVLGLMVVDGVSDGCACSVLISLSGSDMLNHEAAGCRSGFWCSFFPLQDEDLQPNVVSMNLKAPG